MYDAQTGQETVIDLNSDNDQTSGRTDGGAGILDILNQKESGLPEITNFSDLYLIGNPEDFPWSANVKLFFTKGGLSYEASGVLIDPMHVLTAGHCVHEGSGGSWVTDMVVLPGYEDGDEPYRSAGMINMMTWTGWAYNGDFNHDMGIIYLDRPIGAVSGWYAYGYDENDNFFRDSTFHNPGYPGEYPYDGDSMFYWAGDFDNVYTNQVRFNKQSYGGQSGSGVFNTYFGQRYVYAELSNGSSYYTNDCRITSDKFGAISDYIDEHTPLSVDLVPVFVQTEPSFVDAGEQLTEMTYAVHNYGYANYNGTVNVNVYLSEDNNITSSDIWLQSHSFTYNFGPKATAFVDVTYPPFISEYAQSGDYYVGIILDIADYNVNNNASNGEDASEIYVGGIWRDVLQSGEYIVRANDPSLCHYNQTINYWAVTGIRPSYGDDWDIRLYNDTLFQNQVAYSVEGGSAVDFVVADYNHSPFGWHGIRIDQYSGSSLFLAEYETGYDQLSAPGTNGSFNWENFHVVKIWDVFLSAGESFDYALDITYGTIDLGMALFKSDGTSYYRGKSFAQVTADQNGSGVDESFSYTAPADDWYAVVVWCNNDDSGSYQIDITETTTADVSIDMIPDNPPVQVQQGGYFTFTGLLNNNTNQYLVGDVWIMLRLPNYQMYGPIEQFFNIPMDPYENLTYQGVRQNIPYVAPLGDYEYIAYCGDYPNYITDQASFPFTVTSALASAGGNNEWNLMSWFGDEAEVIPHTTSLHDNYPNPFNPVTTISYDLANDGEVTLEVYNLMGQKMQTLVNGYESAGKKSITWDASTYSSSVYFYRLTTEDNVFTKKMTLMK
ncbi:MAG: T9SS type A sorting domain-containing protein [candidate division Zixibacteria bacterium]|nr:T9SS type A sorting domain-containing protein [candidate division Zixibacteria bacterium]